MFKIDIDKQGDTEDKNISIIGLGYVGLPLAVSAANRGHKVYGIDISKERIDSLLSSKSYISDVKDSEISEIINKKLIVSCDYSNITNTDTIIICVPTPLNKNKEPDLSYITNVMDELIKHISKGTLIVLESTVYPGATRELIGNNIEGKLDYEIGKDIFVCFSPERIDPGNRKYNVANTPKVIGGYTERCLERGKIMYESFINDIIPVSSLEVAEMSKLLENTFRNINIAFINEITMMCDSMNINIWDVISAASTKPYGYTPFYPGAGVGGHCLPIDPIYLSWKAKTFKHYNRFIELSRSINDNMPKYVVNNILYILNDLGKAANNSNILILGIAYKKDCADLREAPALEIIELLYEFGANVDYYDPYIGNCEIKNSYKYSIDLNKDSIDEFDIIVIITDHSNVDYDMIFNSNIAIYDTKNIENENPNSNVILLGNYKPS